MCNKMEAKNDYRFKTSFISKGDLDDENVLCIDCSESNVAFWEQKYNSFEM